MLDDTQLHDQVLLLIPSVQTLQATLDALVKVLASLEAGDGEDVVDRNRRLHEMTEMADTLEKNLSRLRKETRDRDPTTGTDGHYMSKQMLWIRFDKLGPKITTVTETVSTAYAEHERNMAAQREQEAAAAPGACAVETEMVQPEEWHAQTQALALHNMHPNHGAIPATSPPQSAPTMTPATAPKVLP
jgi:hypothetical protein